MALPHPIGVMATGTSFLASLVVAQTQLVESPGELAGFVGGFGIFSAGLWFIVRMLSTTTNSTIQDLARKDQEIKELKSELERQSERISVLINALIRAGVVVPTATRLLEEDS